MPEQLQALAATTTFFTSICAHKAECLSQLFARKGDYRQQVSVMWILHVLYNYLFTYPSFALLLQVKIQNHYT